MTMDFSVKENKNPRESNVAYQMISMASILSELANYGEKKIIVPNTKSIEVVKGVLDSFSIDYQFNQIDEQEYFITMKDSLRGN